MKLIIFSDIDGTFYPANFTAHSQTVADIKHAQAQGVHFVFCTGNPYFGYIKDLAHKVDATYIITSNGAAVLNVKTSAYLHTRLISQVLTAKMLAHANALGLATDWWDEHHLFFNSFVPQHYVDYWAARSSFVVRVSDAALGPCFKIEFQHDADAHRLDAMMTFLTSLGVEAARINPRHIEVTAPGVSKGSAIKWLAAHLEVPLSETMGIGDSANDLSMFAVVGHAYAMANAPVDIKAKAHHHTAAVEQNGLGLAIHDFLYRKGYRQ